MNTTLQLIALQLLQVAKRPAAALTLLLAITGVTLITVGTLTMAEGIQSGLDNPGAADRVVVMREGVTSEVSSWLGNESVEVITSYPAVTAHSRELFVSIDIETSSGYLNLAARGVTPEAISIRDELQLTTGRWPQTGKMEISVGHALTQLHPELATGNSLDLRNGEWQIVGTMEGAGGAHDAEVWLDLALAQQLFRREGAVNSLRVRLADDDLEGFKAFLANDQRTNAHALAEPAFYALFAGERIASIQLFAWFLGAVMSIGAAACAFNASYSNMQTRRREIATLRSLGFSDSAIAIASLMESLLVGLLGSAIAILLLWLFVDGQRGTTLSADITTYAFAFDLTPELLFLGVGAALLISFLGAIIPVFRATRVPITTHL